MITIVQSTSPYHVTKEQLAVEERQILVAKKDRSKFAPLYDKYYEQIFRFIYQRLSDKDVAADLCSQVFLKAMLNMPKYELRGLPFSSWLYRIAKNELNLHFRSQKSDRTINVETNSLRDIAVEVEEKDNDMEVRKMLEALQELSTKEVELIEMRFFEKRSFKEIGEILGISENNSKVRMYRTLDKMRKILTKKEG